MYNPTLEVRNLHCELGKRSKRAHILRGVNLTIEAGTILAVLGANGAGKTTLVNVLSTLLPYTEGSVRINGHDLATDPAGVRQSIALTGQYAAVDPMLTGKENLQYFGALSGLTTSEAAARATALLTQFGLEAAGDRRVSDYSGGMRRRLDIAVSLIVPPALLFLDEPTTGLDPASRNDVWAMIKELSSSGTAILLTTQYLEEADILADRIAVLAQGTVIDEGTPQELKGRYGTPLCTITFRDSSDADAFRRIVSEQGYELADGTEEGPAPRVIAPNGYRDMVRILSLWKGAEEAIIDAAMTPPSLDDVYMAVADSGDVARKDETSGRNGHGNHSAQGTQGATA